MRSAIRGIQVELPPSQGQQPKSDSMRSKSRGWLAEAQAVGHISELLADEIWGKTAVEKNVESANMGLGRLVNGMHR